MKYRIAYHDTMTGKQAFIHNGVAMDEAQARKMLEKLQESSADDTRFTFWLVEATREEPL